jgi:hypothetical protein
MKNILLIIGICTWFQAALAQSSKNKIVVPVKDKSSKLLKIFTTGESVSVEGYDGDNVIIESLPNNGDNKIPTEAAGLKNISPSQHIQPDTLVPVIFEKDKTLQINLLKESYSRSNFLIKIPQNIHFSLLTVSKLPHDKLSLKNLTGELEVKSGASSVNVSHITGPLVLISENTDKLTNINVSNLDWKLIPNVQDKPALYIVAPDGSVHLSLPGKANVTLCVKTTYGKLFTDLNFTPLTPPLIKDSFYGKLNSGGVPITIINQYGNVNVKKEK